MENMIIFSAQLPSLEKLISAKVELGVKNIFLSMEEVPDLQANLNAINPEAEFTESWVLAQEIAEEAVKRDCLYLSFEGEPSIMFALGKVAEKYGIIVVEATTKPIPTVHGIVYEHVQWRALQ